MTSRRYVLHPVMHTYTISYIQSWPYVWPLADRRSYPTSYSCGLGPGQTLRPLEWHSKIHDRQALEPRPALDGQIAQTLSLVMGPPIDA
jgi:hypothetical protein